jgi:hypothetical protein
MVPRGVLVLELAGKSVGDCLEPAVRMRRGSDGLPGRVINGTHLVQKKERVDPFQARTRKRPAYDEPAAFVLEVRWDDPRRLPRCTR